MVGVGKVVIGVVVMGCGFEMIGVGDGSGVD